jgi:hypothetical protein
MHKWFLLFLMVLGLVGFTAGYATADSGTASAVASVPLALPSGWPGLVMLALVAASWAMKKFSSWAPLHTTAGAAVAGLASALIPALMQALSHGWNVMALETAAVGATLSYFANDNPSNTKEQQQAIIASMKNGSGGAVGPGPTITKVGVMLPLAFLFSFAGCAHATPSEKAFGIAYGACMEAKGLAAAPGVGSEAWNDLTKGTNATTIETQLEQLALKAGVDAVGCAVASFLNAPVTAPDGGAKLTAEAPKNPAGVTAAKAFLERHSRTTSL